MSELASESKKEQGPLRALGRYLYDKLVRPVLTVRDSPHSIALGLAMGLWVSLTPTVGIQLPTVFALGTLLRANRIAAMVITWVSNPVTMLPLYYVYYLFGLMILGRDGKSYAIIKEEFADATDHGGWEAMSYVFDVFGTPLWIGSLIIATLITAPVYPLARRYFKRREDRLRDSLEERDSAARQIPAEGESR